MYKCTEYDVFAIVKNYVDDVDSTCDGDGIFDCMRQVKTAPKLIFFKLEETIGYESLALYSAAIKFFSLGLEVYPSWTVLSLISRKLNLKFN